MFKIKVALEETRKYNSSYSVLYLSSDPNILAMYTHMDSQESNSINMLEISNEAYEKDAQDTLINSEAGLEDQSQYAEKKPKISITEAKPNGSIFCY